MWRCFALITYVVIMVVAIAPILVPKNVFNGEVPPPAMIDDLLSIVPVNTAIPLSPSESISSSSSYPSQSPQSDMMSETESMDQGRKS